MDKKARILIVDDNISLCKTMSFVLKRKGYTVATARDGLKAIDKAKEKSFDIIFLDIKMPLMDGVEAYRRIKKIRPEAVVVMMTAYAVEDLIQEALQEGASGIISKPLDIDNIVVLIERAREVRQGELILVVDDDPKTCVTLKDILIKKDYKVGIAHTCEEAMSMAQDKAYDIIFIHMKLPAIKDLETYLAIKEVNPGAVAIMVTAYRQEMADLMKKTFNSASYMCLNKPLDMVEVLSLVEEIQERKQNVR